MVKHYSMILMGRSQISLDLDLMVRTILEPQNSLIGIYGLQERILRLKNEQVCGQVRHN